MLRRSGLNLIRRPTFGTTSRPRSQIVATDQAQTRANPPTVADETPDDQGAGNHDQDKQQPMRRSDRAMGAGRGIRAGPVNLHVSTRADTHHIEADGIFSIRFMCGNSRRSAFHGPRVPRRAVALAQPHGKLPRPLANVIHVQSKIPAIRFNPYIPLRPRELVPPHHQPQLKCVMREITARPEHRQSQRQHKASHNHHPAHPPEAARSRLGRLDGCIPHIRRAYLRKRAKAQPRRYAYPLRKG